MSSFQFSNGVIQLLLYLLVLMLLAWPLSIWMKSVYESKRLWGESLLYKVCGVDAAYQMNFKQYAMAMLVFNGIGLVVVYLLQRLQYFLPLNLDKLANVPPDLAFNTAVSFVSNTNWQSYGGETTLSYLTQMLGLTVQNFLSAATGMAVLVALTRGFARHEAASLGNFYVDMSRSILYILLPLSLLLSISLIGAGCPQTLEASRSYTTYESGASARIALGPVASQVAIKQLGTNGGGYFSVNSSHPYENPNACSNFLEALAILLIPAGLCLTFGLMVRKAKEGLTILVAMTILFVVSLAAAVWSESSFVWQSPDWHLAWGNAGNLNSGDGGSFANVPNMEGKEQRFGMFNSMLWATATTAASNGSVNAMHDSFSPLGGLVPMFLMQLGEVVYGGVGSGLYGMLVFALITVFMAGLMVGRTPEYLGKKIESFDMKMCSLVILIPPMVVLLGTALACVLPEGRSAVLNSGPHAFSEILYAFSSAGNNNGSAFAGLSANQPFYNCALAIAMFLARYWLAVPVLALAGSLAAKKSLPAGEGTMPTDNWLFVSLLIGVVLIFGGLTFVPALALGPVVEHLLNFSR